MTKTLDEAITNLRKEAGEDEKAAEAWIRHNPHVALIYALKAHQDGWYGCNCGLSKMDYDGLQIMHKIRV